MEYGVRKHPALNSVDVEYGKNHVESIAKELLPDFSNSEWWYCAKELPLKDADIGEIAEIAKKLHDIKDRLSKTAVRGNACEISLVPGTIELYQSKLRVAP